MSSSSRKMMLDTDVVGELEELAVPAAMPTGKPAGFGRMQNEATRDAAHDIFGGNVRVIPLLANGFHDVLEAVAGDASLHVVADEFSPGQSPRPIRTKVTPSVHGCRNSLRKAFEHGCCSALICSRVTFKAFLPIPASGIRHSDVGRGDKVMTIVAHVLLALQLVAVFFLEEVDRPYVGEMFQPTLGSSCMSSFRNFHKALQKIMYSRLATLAKISFEKACAMARMKRGCLGWP